MNKNPDLVSLYYHITNKCNLKCKHCWVDSEKTLVNELSFDEAKDIILQAIPLGLHSIKFTGGEPFIVPWLMDFLEFIDDHNIDMTFETNGTLISDKIASQLAKLKVGSIAVSLDGSNATIHEAIRGVKGCFDATIRGIKNLCKAKLHPGILVAVDRSNLADIPTLVAFVKNFDIGYLKFNVMQPIGRGQSLREKGMLLSRKECSNLFFAIGDLEKDVSFPIEMIFPPILCPVSKMRKQMCITCNIPHVLGLLADGRVAMCGIGNTEGRLVYGNIRETSLEEIWKTNPHPVLKEVRKTFPKELTGVCGKCMFKDYCQGICRAVAFERYGSITAPHPACQEAFEAGLVSVERIEC